MGLKPAYGDGFVAVANRTEGMSNLLKGDLCTDGSIRWVYDEVKDVIRAEKLVLGIWELQDVEIGVGTWVVDDDSGEFVLDEFGNVVYEG